MQIVGLKNGKYIYIEIALGTLETTCSLEIYNNEEVSYNIVNGEGDNINMNMVILYLE